MQFDGYEGWIDNKQYLEITETAYSKLSTINPVYATDLVGMITTNQHQIISVPMGSAIGNAAFVEHSYEGNVLSTPQPKGQIVATALLYLNAPYLWGGKTPFGIDCSGLSQMCYRINGHSLLRDASEQATQGEPLSFIEESEPGDLAFFDNAEGNIIHVGIIMEDNYIIHAHGQVRIDRLDHTGIFNYERRQHTHKLRVIKRII